jgi:rSAM/selenodomain-associated transferase 1
VNKAIVIFARAPVPGQVKTRLARQVGDAGAAQLYAAMLRDTIAVVAGVAHTLDACEVVLAYTPETALQRGEYSLLSFWSGAHLAQCDGDLGERMLDCMARLHEQGRQRVVLIGSDTPHMPQSTLRNAFDSLEQNELCIWRTADGGFNLIGTSAVLPSMLFEGVEWSTERVFDQVAANAQALQLKWSLAFDGHDDVDTFADLQRLICLLGEGRAYAPETERCLRLQGLL